MKSVYEAEFPGCGEAETARKQASLFLRVVAARLAQTKPPPDAPPERKVKFLGTTAYAAGVISACADVIENKGEPIEALHLFVEKIKDVTAQITGKDAKDVDPW